MKNKHGLPAQAGFTLMELLIVIGIIGILISVSVASFSTAQKKGRDARRLGDMKAMQNAFEQYYADHNSSYPATCHAIIGGAGLDPVPTPTISQTRENTIPSVAGATTYLPAGFPVDPRNFTGTGPGDTFVYDFADSHCSDTSFCFCAHLESGTGNAAAPQAGSDCTFSTGSYYCVGNLE